MKKPIKTKLDANKYSAKSTDKKPLKKLKSSTRIEATKVAYERLKIVFAIILIGIFIFFIIALSSFSILDPSWSTYSSQQEIHNYAGVIGSYSAGAVLSLLGVVGFLLPLFILDNLRLVFIKNHKTGFFLQVVKMLGWILFVVSLCGFAEILLFFLNEHLPQRSGGILGYEITKYAKLYLNSFGASLVFLVMLLSGITMYFGYAWTKFVLASSKYVWSGLKKLLALKKLNKDDSMGYIPTLQEEEQQSLKPDPKHTFKKIKPEIINTPKPEIELSKTRKLDKKLFKKTEMPKAINFDNVDKKLPRLDLLTEPDLHKNTIPETKIKRMSSLLEQTLAEFKVKAKVINALPGPIVTRYEILLDAGIKASKLTGVAQDIARVMSVSAVRVVEVIPGKPYVGIEVPNDVKNMVRIKEILSSDEFINSPKPTIMGLGADIGGYPFFVDLQKMPHLLVAGTTGSGKSVGINAMIISMLYKASPEDLKFIMIDPKMLELSIYEGIPHLLTSVVTDMSEAANSLRWCVREMERRYELMSIMGVRNIELLNKKIAEESKKRPIRDPLFVKYNPERVNEAPFLEKLPFIVIVADEFADLIMVEGKKMEELIVRLAQKARAAGIHIILATQRPSVDVVTGLIKANIPTRISFQVSSRIDSRTIIDQQGAEQLLGHGDMLYVKPGLRAPIRVHGAFVDDDEVHRVVDFWKSVAPAEYIEEISQTGDVETAESEDELYDDAVAFILETQKASISALQRRLRIGYNRSARLLDEMQEKGIVSEMNNKGVREVLVKGVK